jgi:hypothetical protein
MGAVSHNLKEIYNFELQFISLYFDYLKLPSCPAKNALKINVK